MEAAILDHENEQIQLAHLLAAAYEGPLVGGRRRGVRRRAGGSDADALVAIGRAARGREGRYLPRGPRFPAGEISLRSASPDSVAIVERSSGELLGAVEARARLHHRPPRRRLPAPGALLRGRASSTSRRGARSSTAFDGDWYTQPKKETEVFIERIVAKSADPIADGLGVELCFGEVSVTEQVIAFQRKRLSDHEVIDLVALDLPETNFPTQALWYELADELAGPSACRSRCCSGALHAAEHAQIAVLPLLAMCDRWDIGGLSTNVHFQTGRPTIFIYDGHPGGVGITRRGFERFERLVADAATLIGECPCDGRLPVVRAVAEVRQPQRAAAQAGRAGADGGDAEPSRREGRGG